jgi:hypothetical protein
MNETSENRYSNEIIKEREINWAKLDQPNIDAVNSQLKGSGLNCLDDIICFKNFNSNTVNTLMEMLSDVSAGQEKRDKKINPLSMMIRAVNPKGEDYLIYACKPTEKKEFFEKLNTDLNTINERLNNVGSPIRLPEHK